MAITWGDSYTSATLNVATPLEVSATSGTVSFTLPTIQAKMSDTYISESFYIGLGRWKDGGTWSDYGTAMHLKYGDTILKYLRGQSSGKVSKNVYTNLTYTSPSPTTISLNTATYFNSSNANDRSISLDMVAPINCEMVMVASGPIECRNTSTAKTLSTITVTLNVPPTATVSAITYDKPFIYAGLTTASVTASDVAAYYGGSVTDVTLKIGAQSASISGNGTLSILLDTAGTFTPTVTVTDSRGQTKTYTLSQITVNSYSAPTVSFTAERTTSAGKPDDEGTYATCPSTFIFADAIADLITPSVVLTDENGTQTTPTVIWYTTRASDGTLSGTVNWSNVSAGDTVYGLIPGLNTNYSYQISIRPRDSQGTGTAITQTVSSAFYTVDFLAGGHGIAFGQPSSQVGFFCNMDAHFVDANSVMRALFDFVYPVGSYYETSDTAFNPNVTWGGTWSLETEGQVHVSAGANYPISGALSNTTDGGEVEHKLTTNEMPSHNHRVNYVNYNRGSGSSATMGYLSSSSQSNYAYSENEGNDAPHNNMQPYIIVNRWHRTA